MYIEQDDMNAINPRKKILINEFKTPNSISIKLKEEVPSN
jgi:hypothetical protein